MHVVVQRKHLLIKGRVIGQNARGVRINPQPFPDGLQGDHLVFVRDDPVQLCLRQILAKGNIHKMNIRQKLFGFRYRINSKCAMLSFPGLSFL